MDFVVNVEESLDRARLTAGVYSLTYKANELFIQSTIASSAKVASQLQKEGQDCINKADSMRIEFWGKYPQAYIKPSCPWMRKEHGR